MNSVKTVLEGRWFIMLLLFTAGMLTYSCSQVKFVPEDNYLVNKVDIEIDNPELNKEEAKAFVRQKENYKILGFLKFHLMMYNLSSRKKKDDWLKRIGEAPQLYEEVLTSRSEDQLRQYAINKGFFGAVVTSKVEKDEQKQKLDVKFEIKTGRRFLIRDLNYHIADPSLEELFSSSEVIKMLEKGDPFDLDILEEQQKAIVKLFRNNGYFFFSGDFVRAEGDTLSYPGEIVLDIHIASSVENRADSAKVFKKYYFNNFYISVLPGNTPVTAGRDAVIDFSDTLSWDNYYLYQNDQVKYPPSLIRRTMKIDKGDLYNSAAVENTFTAFNRLRQFRFVDIHFKQPEALQDSNKLDGIIRLAPLSKQSTTFDIEGTNTAGNFGIAGNVTYQHRNLFRSAEVFQVKFKGATERLQYLDEGGSESFNTREIGVESSLMIPKLLGPGMYISDFRKFLPKTVISAGYNYQQRPEYTRTITNLKFGYEWKTTEELRHIWNLLDFNLVDVFKFDSEFIEDIRDLYIKSSFTDHLIMAANYSVVFNNQKLNSKKSYTYARLNVESAGNMLGLVSNLASRQKYRGEDLSGVTTSDYYKILNTRFAQYVKSDLEISHGHLFDPYNTIVGRAFVGIGIPYGNFDVLPFEKKYFTGGANGIRAWQVRSLGPGSYNAPKDAYPNQSSDIKLEANLEYRFNLTRFLEGALFLDAGNIWAINDKDNRPGAKFEFGSFYRQIAVGTGAGMRFDLSYFIFRLDLGIKMRDPAALKGERWIIGNRKLTGSDLNLSFAIGYPF